MTCRQGVIAVAKMWADHLSLTFWNSGTRSWWDTTWNAWNETLIYVREIVICLDYDNLESHFAYISHIATHVCYLMFCICIFQHLWCAWWGQGQGFWAGDELDLWWIEPRASTSKFSILSCFLFQILLSGWAMYLAKKPRYIVSFLWILKVATSLLLLPICRAYN
jgi:hypothetical protein